MLRVDMGVLVHTFDDWVRCRIKKRRLGPSLWCKTFFENVDGVIDLLEKDCRRQTIHCDFCQP